MELLLKDYQKLLGHVLQVYLESNGIRKMGKHKRNGSSSRMMLPTVVSRQQGTSMKLVAADISFAVSIAFDSNLALLKWCVKLVVK